MFVPYGVESLTAVDCDWSSVRVRVWDFNSPPLLDDPQRDPETDSVLNLVLML